MTFDEIKAIIKDLKIVNYSLKPAEFSKANLKKNRKIMEETQFNEIPDLKYSEYILLIIKK
ncbi:MAG: hypothetical protein COT14_01385 [Candidatus Diapherotrites archaeon CG08_land_8_20_14_0_20_30_16]|nr:MAG: hypothetical protein COT14_01385 [Candidatus Diapherotrites archaeon CG08_land_8_20_14_0_20_30_16]